MEYLQNILDGTNIPILSAFILGIMTAISPCPLATNITAIGFISKNIERKSGMFYNGLWYILGRTISYTLLGIILYFGASKFEIASFFSSNSQKFLGPLLIIIGVFMLDFLKIKFPGIGKLGEKIGNSKNQGSWWSALLLGLLFALAFCPYSGVLYFGMLIPMTISSPSGLYLPVVFAVATGLPVVIIAYLLAFSISSVGNFYNRIKAIEKWLRLVVAVLFIGVGFYYVLTYYFLN